MTRKSLENYFLSIGEKKFKALQVFEWLYEKKKYNAGHVGPAWMDEYGLCKRGA